jgi:hypothetical protein
MSKNLQKAIEAAFANFDKEQWDPATTPSPCRPYRPGRVPRPQVHWPFKAKKGKKMRTRTVDRRRT